MLVCSQTVLEDVDFLVNKPNEIPCSTANILKTGSSFFLETFRSKQSLPILIINSIFLLYFFNKIKHTQTLKFKQPVFDNWCM